VEGERGDITLCHTYVKSFDGMIDGLFKIVHILLYISWFQDPGGYGDGRSVY
jgi:hypothetical protein